MKRMVAVILMLLCSSMAAYGADSKVEAFAKSPKISTLYVKTSGDKILYEGALAPDSPQGITEQAFPNSIGDASFRYDFVQNKPLRVYYQDFNPLETSIKLDSKDEKTDLNDPSSFFKVLATYQPIFAPALAAQQAKQEGATTGQLFAKKLGRSPASAAPPVVEGETPDLQAPSVPQNDEECDTLIIKFRTLVNAYNNMGPDEKLEDKDVKKRLEELAINESNWKQWKAKTASFAGINDVIASINKFREEKLETNIKSIKAAMDDIEGTKEEGTCYSLPVIAVAEISYVMTKATETVKHRQASSAGLKGLSDYLSSYVKEKRNWNDSNYLIGNVPEPAKQNLKKVTITSKPVVITASDDVVAVKDGDKAIASTFTVYKHENFVFEGAAGFVYSELVSRKFSTKTVNGNQVVVKTEDSDNYHAAAFLNIYKTSWTANQVYPFFQLGLSTAKDYPALLTGIGMKILDTSFAVSVGAAFGFTKELNHLSEGATVTGQADIDKDEKISVTPNWYLSLQYSF